MKRSSIFLAATAVLTLSACEGFKEALTAHVDVVAKAGSQELSVTRLADLLGKTRVPLNKDVAGAVTDVWVDFQLLARAAAHNDSLNDPKVVDDVMWPAISQTRVAKLYKELTKSWHVDTSGTATKYANGDILAASHILLMTQGLPPDSAAAVAKRATALRAQLTPTNFAEMAQKNSQDNGSAGRGGDLGIFQKGQMVPEFEKAVLALKPGEISQPVKTQYGYHIIRRTPFDEVREQAAQALNGPAYNTAESTYVAHLETAAKVEVKPNAAATVKTVAKDLDAHMDDNTVVATSTRGQLTAGKVARWITGFPNSQQLRQQIAQAPDSVFPGFVKNLMRNELLLQQADSAKIGLDTTELNELHRNVKSTVANLWSGLHIAPKELADSAKTESERERLAASRVDSYLTQVVTGEVQMVSVPKPISQMLRKHFDSKVNPAGLERAVEQAIKVRGSGSDSGKAPAPPSAVPTPGAPGQAAPGGQAPPPVPAPKKP